MKQLYIIWTIILTLANILLLSLLIFNDAFDRFGILFILSIIPQYSILYVGLKEHENKAIFVMYCISILPTIILYFIVKFF